MTAALITISVVLAVGSVIEDSLWLWVAACVAALASLLAAIRYTRR